MYRPMTYDSFTKFGLKTVLDSLDHFFNLDSLLILFKQKYWRSVESTEYSRQLSKYTKLKSISTFPHFPESASVDWGCNYLE